MSSRRLKKGFTTGAAAAAAVKAALLSVYSFRPPVTSVEIRFLTGTKKDIDIKSVKKIQKNQYEAIVVKDAGDDPDITHKAEIGARVTVRDAEKTSIHISGGQGVGTVTKPGLELAVGEPAINPGPQKMIKNSVNEVFDRFKIQNTQVEIEIFVPKGEELAEKTLNARLGIMGGISILGTTGIVTPMSHDAYIAAIKSGISVVMKVLIDLPLLLLVQALVANYFYSPSREASEQFFFKFLLLGQKVTDEFITLHDLLTGRSAIHRQFAYTGPDLLLQATDTFHEKFIEIGIDNGQELDAFQ